MWPWRGLACKTPGAKAAKRARAGQRQERGARLGHFHGVRGGRPASPRTPALRAVEGTLGQSRADYSALDRPSGNPRPATATAHQKGILAPGGIEQRLSARVCVSVATWRAAKKIKRLRMDLPSHPMHISLTSCARAPGPPRPRHRPPKRDVCPWLGSNRDYRLVCVCVCPWRHGVQQKK